MNIKTIFIAIIFSITYIFKVYNCQKINKIQKYEKD